MDRAVRDAIAAVFTRHEVSDLWLIHDDVYPSEAVFMVGAADHERLNDDRALWREVAALLPDTKLGLIPYTDRAQSRRLLPQRGGVQGSG